MSIIFRLIHSEAQITLLSNLFINVFKRILLRLQTIAEIYCETEFRIMY